MKQYDFWINDQFQKDDENAIVKGVLSYLPGSHVFLQRIPFNDSSLLTIITKSSLSVFADQVIDILEQFTEEVDVKIDEVGPLFTYRYKLESIPKRQEKQLINNIKIAFGFLNYPIISLFTPESVDHTFLTVETGGR